jgi:photosystem II stability/assembly factor-like uncharacterized protein
MNEMDDAEVMARFSQQMRGIEALVQDPPAWQSRTVRGTAKVTGTSSMPTPVGLLGTAIALVALLVFAIAGGPKLIGREPTPTGLPARVSAPPVTPIPSPVASAPVSNAFVSDGGSTASGGWWIIQRDNLFTATSVLGPWLSHRLPSQPISGTSPFVLDKDHAWLVSSAVGSTEWTGSPSDVLRLIVNRTSDGGQTWIASSISGNYAGTTQVLVFADAYHGFLICSALRHSSGLSTILATDDGGDTWHTTGTTDWLGSQVVISGSGSLWAGDAGDAGPIAHSLLSSSVDSGQSWNSKLVPGLRPDNSDSSYLPIPPDFSDPNTGLLVATDATSGTTLRFFETTGGGAWAQRGSLALESFTGAAARIDASRWVVADGASHLFESGDGGQSWKQTQPAGLPSGQLIWLEIRASGDGLALLLDNAANAVALATTDGGATWRPAVLAK